jgi:hypothetical protein
MTRTRAREGAYLENTCPHVSALKLNRLASVLSYSSSESQESLSLTNAGESRKHSTSLGRPLFSFRLACVALRRGNYKLGSRVPHTLSRALEFILMYYQIDAHN